MAYLHCHNCGWSQDDFYSESYNPAKYLMTWNNFLFGDDIGRRDILFSNDAEFIRKNGCITTREVIAQEYEKFAKRIRTMKWLTEKEFRNDPNKACPICGSKKLDID